MTRTPEEAKEKWAERIRGSGKYMKSGLEHPREDWATQAKGAKERRDAELRRAIEEDRINKGIEKAGTKKWQTRALDVGVGRWTADAPKSAEEYKRGISDVISAVEEAKEAIKDLPETTVEERAEKSKQYQIAVSEAMKKKRGY